LTSGQEDWTGRAAVEWAQALNRSRAFDGAAEQFLPAAEALDAIYTQASS
jgi:hypothetical protein